MGTSILSYNIDRHINPKEVVDDILENKIVGVANAEQSLDPEH